MNTIISPAKYVDLLLGKPIISNCDYKLSQFNCSVNFDDKILLHNTFTKECIIMNKCEYNEFLNLDRNGENFNFFVEHRFFVEKTIDEVELLTQIQNTADILDSKNYVNQFYILTTTDCNARCYYCFESGINKSNMTPQTAKEVVNYIEKVSKGHDVTIRWFGGEPLYNMEAIDTIVSGLKAKNINFNSFITTNAFLFSEDVIKKAKEEWNLLYAQITIDGPEEKYNRIKNYIYTSVNSPYKVVIQNIKSLLKSGIDVRIQINVGKHTLGENNINEMKALIDNLNDEFIQFENVKFTSNLIMDTSSKIPTEPTVREEVINIFMDIRGHMIKTGKYLQQPLYLNMAHKKCLANDPSYTYIMPNGDLAKCNREIENSVYGNIFDTKVDNETLTKFTIRHKPIKLCYDCPCLPNCNKLVACPLNKKGICNEPSKRMIIEYLKQSIYSAVREKIGTSEY